MPRQRLFFFHLFASLLLLPMFLGNVWAVPGSADDLQTHPDSSNSVNATLAAMSDEQVRQMLIAELQKDVDAENQPSSLEPEISGPSAPLAKILRSLNEETGQSETQLRKLLAGSPNLLPDLYRVFVSL